MHIRGFNLSFALLFATVGFISGCTTQGYSALHRNDVAAMKKALDSGESPNSVFYDERVSGEVSFLTHALIRQRYDMAKLLLDRGADPHKAVRRYLFLSTGGAHDGSGPYNPDKGMSLLLGAGLDPNFSYPGQGRLIYMLCELPSIMEMVVKAGADMRADSRADRPLKFALTLPATVRLASQSRQRSRARGP